MGVGGLGRKGEGRKEDKKARGAGEEPQRQEETGRGKAGKAWMLSSDSTRALSLGCVSRLCARLVVRECACVSVCARAGGCVCVCV